MELARTNRRTLLVLLGTVGVAVLLSSDARASCGDYLHQRLQSDATPLSESPTDFFPAQAPSAPTQACRDGSCRHEAPVSAPVSVRRLLDDSVTRSPAHVYEQAPCLLAILLEFDVAVRTAGFLDEVFHPPRRARERC